jgi:hypothetical protein
LIADTITRSATEPDQPVLARPAGAPDDVEAVAVFVLVDIPAGVAFGEDLLGGAIKGLFRVGRYPAAEAPANLVADAADPPGWERRSP